MSCFCLRGEFTDEEEIALINAILRSVETAPNEWEKNERAPIWKHIHSHLKVDLTYGHPRLHLSGGPLNRRIGIYKWHWRYVYRAFHKLRHMTPTPGFVDTMQALSPQQITLWPQRLLPPAKTSMAQEPTTAAG